MEMTGMFIEKLSIFGTYCTYYTLLTCYEPLSLLQIKSSNVIHYFSIAGDRIDNFIPEDISTNAVD